MATDALLFQLKDQLITAKLAVLAVEEATAQEVKYMEGTLQERQLELWLLLQDNLLHLQAFTKQAADKIQTAANATAAARAGSSAQRGY